jgi:hypothetical protein
MEPLKNVQVEGHLMYAEPEEIFGNLDELCYVRHSSNVTRNFILIFLYPLSEYATLRFGGSMCVSA